MFGRTRTSIQSIRQLVNTPRIQCLSEGAGTSFLMPYGTVHMFRAAVRLVGAMYH